MTNYHVVRVSPIGGLTLRNSIAADPAFAELDYARYLERILLGGYNYSDVFSYQMRRLGNRCDEILYDVEAMQKRWAAENNLLLEQGEPWQLKIALAQLKKLNPDVIYLQGFTRITPKAVDQIRDELPNLKLIAVHSGFPNGLDDITPDTLIFCGVPSIQESFLALGANAHLVYHSFDERILEGLDNQLPEIPFSFVGSSGFGYGHGHKTRYWNLLKLVHNSEIQVWLDDKDAFVDPRGDSNPFNQAPLKAHFYNDLNPDYSQYPNPFTPLRNLLPPAQVNAPCYGTDFFQLLQRSLITYHRHTDAVHNEVGAMRLFQATGVGACLMTDPGANLPHLYEADSEVVTYSSLAEGIEKADYLLRHPEQARAIAAKGQARTLKDHSATVRYELVHRHICTALRGQ